MAALSQETEAKLRALEGRLLDLRLADAEVISEEMEQLMALMEARLSQVYTASPPAMGSHCDWYIPPPLLRWVLTAIGIYCLPSCDNNKLVLHELIGRLYLPTSQKSAH
eukprot:1196238-Prorocentrum_minimum.AAC.2